MDFFIYGAVVVVSGYDESEPFSKLRAVAVFFLGG